MLEYVEYERSVRESWRRFNASAWLYPKFLFTEWRAWAGLRVDERLAMHLLGSYINIYSDDTFNVWEMD